MSPIGRISSPLPSAPPAPPQNLADAISDSLADRHLSGDEMKQLTELIKADKSMPDALKGKLIDVLKQARDDSRGFLGLFKGSINDKELGQLQDLSQNLGDSPIANSLRETFEEMATSSARERSAYRGGQVRSAAFEPGDGPCFPMPNRPTTVSADGSQPTAPEPETCLPTPINYNPRPAGAPSFDHLYVTQNGNNLPSGGGDCGPAVGSMVLKHFGFVDQGTSSRNAILAFRRAVGVTQPRNGKWAISEDEIAKGISSLSGGQVRQSGNKSVANGAALRSEVQSQLSKGSLPIIEVASPYGSKGRHYMIALGVKPNGNVEVADPGGKHHWEITPQQLDELVRLGNQRGGSKVLSFSRATTA